ncbi:hypothetical protein [Cellvibrio japonicus]|uniref:hypothetical protein n=1 Tax=Cellvibrio japonicus TaxID=155077 RepID=UPI0005A23088|nr:hypothetical protein [Cellvibrio japonicus]QEI11462.1 hypothetical protein FY117_03935 [Cellvibrio japonicus]QEI15036.1 hypothetical protein FY116_03935 [Cellvibrio japonicus]QEI18616.1 hypothetical protein FY115_03935 [Cellvibrio japonicus]
MPFTFQSNIARLVLWTILILVLALDAYGVWIVFWKQAQVTMPIKVIMLVGVALRLAILFSLIFSKGPIKPLIYIWGGLFVVSGSTGLLSFALSSQTEPVQAYLDKVLYLFAGITLITIASKYISTNISQEN